MKFTLATILVAASTVDAQTWKPGDFSDGKVVEDKQRGTKIFLSNGLMGKAIAYPGEPVIAADGTQLAASYHANCDGGATFAKEDGGYYYVSNSEIGSYPDNLIGGSYSLEFNAAHELLGYKQVLSGTALNCHGGETAWGTWISCEEHREFGRCWEVDPAGVKQATPTDLTGIYNMADFGNWEAFAWDNASSPPRGYTTNDDFQDAAGQLPAYRGAIVRFTPDDAALACLSGTTKEEKWCGVESGTHDFLKLIPDTGATSLKVDSDSSGASKGTFEWVSDLTASNPSLYGGSEGAHVENGILTFSTVLDRYLFRLNLNDMTYTRSAVPFKFEPDNLRVLDDTLYICTDGDEQDGDAVWGWDTNGAYRIFYEINHNYPAGVDFTPDKKVMYVSLYGEATWQFWREDGMAFDAPTAGIKYEVNAGFEEGKTHEEIASEVLAVSVATSTDAPPSGTTSTTTTNGSKDDGSSATNLQLLGATLMAGVLPLAAAL